MTQITRRRSVAVNIGGVKVGGANPIVVQSMTNTDTADITSTVNQVMALARAGSELVRVTVNTEAAAEAVPKIVDTLNLFGVRVPIIGDFHYNGHLLLKKYPEMARALSKYRINPGNVNIGKKHDDNFRVMIEAAIEYDRPVRIGVNWGSLDQALLRPGRIDYRLYLGKATEEQKIELYIRFLPRASTSEAREFVETHGSAETMAEFQGLLLGLEQHRPTSQTDRVLQNS